MPDGSSITLMLDAASLAPPLTGVSGVRGRRKTNVSARPNLAFTYFTNKQIKELVGKIETK